MKRKNGFTLIELLAVIVILAIIALIATPIVLNMINSARKKAAESSAYGFIEAIEYNNGFAQTEQAGYTEITGTDLDVTSSTFNNLKLKGKKPSSGKVTIVNGKVTSANLCVEGYTVVYNGREASVADKKGCSESSEQEEVTCPSSECVYAFPIFNTTSTNDFNSNLATTTFDENQWWYNNGQHCTVMDFSNNNCKTYADHQQTTLQPTNYKPNYEDVISETGKDYFIAMILDNNKKIDRAFLCYKLNGEVSCFEAGKGVDNMIYQQINLSSTTIKTDFFALQDGTYALNDTLEQCANYNPDIPNCEGAYSNYEGYDKVLGCSVDAAGQIGCAYNEIIVNK